MSPARSAVLLAYLLSGLAGLTYEIVWARLLALHLGQTIAAISTVLAAFMGGLALGAAVGGGVAPGLGRAAALRGYGWLELAVAGLALLLAPALDRVTPLLAWAYRDGTGGVVFGVVRTLTAFALVTAPATLMGATWPLVVRGVATAAERAGREVGALYAANTVGAVVGAAATGFVLLPTLGLTRSTLVGVAANVAAAALAFLTSRRAGSVLAARPTTSVSRPLPPRRRGEPPRAAGAPPRPALAATVLGLSGGAALAFEVVWSRLLSLVLGPTVYAFTAVLVCVITGLAAGSALGARLASRTVHPATWLGAALLLPSAIAVGLGWQLDAVLLTVAAAVAAPDATFASVMRTEALLVAGLLVPMSLGFGAAFPLAVSLAASRDERIARDAAVVYSANTLGAIAGSLAAGFLAVPLLGAQGALRAAALVSLASAMLAGGFGSIGRRGQAAFLAAGTTAVLATVAMPPWNRGLLTGGGYKYAAYLRDTDLKASLEAGRLLYDADGATATVTVREVAGARSLAIDGKVDASNAGDMVTQKLLAHLPLLLHPAPQDVCIIGLGSGVTAGAALRHPLARLDVVELSPEVVAASGYFAAENHHALGDPRTRLLVGDGRTHLRLTSRTYDVIVSEPSNPWMAGLASLFTRELFEAARRRLKPGGIFCQWAHTYDISDADLRSIVATFAAVFPHGTMWLVGEGDLLLIGSRAPLEPELDRIGQNWHRPGVAADLAEVEVRSPFALLASFIGGGAALRAYAAGARVQTDDHAPLEFSAPRSIYGASANHAATLRALARVGALPAAVASALARATAADWRDRGRMQLKAEAYAEALEDFARAAKLDPEDPATLDGLTRAAAGADRQADAARLLAELGERHPQSPALPLARSRLLAASGDYDGAIAAAEAVLRRDPSNVEAHLQLASVLADAQAVAPLRAAVARLQTLAPERPATAYYRATLHFLEGRFREAAALAERLVAQEPTDYRAWNLLGAAYGNLGDHERARGALERSVRLNPRDPASHVNLGLFELQAANPDAAVRHFAEALALEPHSPSALAGLADALEQRGERQRARQVRAHLTRLDGPR